MFSADDLPDKIHDLQMSRLVNRVVIKADRDASYGVIEKVMEVLQKNDLNVLNLVTDLEDEVVKIGDSKDSPDKPTGTKM